MKKNFYPIKWHPLQSTITTFTIIKQILEILKTKNKYEN